MEEKARNTLNEPSLDIDKELTLQIRAFSENCLKRESMNDGNNDTNSDTDNSDNVGDDSDKPDDHDNDDNDIDGDDDAAGDGGAEKGEGESGEKNDDTVYDIHIKAKEKYLTVAGTCAKTPDEFKDGKLITSVTVSVEKQRYCDPCKYDDALEIATGCCITCTEYLCQMCYRDHKKNKLTRGHSILKDENMPKDMAPFTAIRDLLKCQTHPENEVAYECVDHKRLICVSCLTESHRKCDEIVDIGISDKNGLTEAADFALVTKLRDRLKVCTQRNVESVDRISRKRDQIKKECEELKEKWKRHIEKLGSLLQREADAWSKREVKASQGSLSECLMMQKDLDQHGDIVSVLKEHGSKKEVAVVSNMLTEKMKMYENKILSIENERPKQLRLRKTAPYTALPSLGSVSLQFADTSKATGVKSAKNIRNAEGTETNVNPPDIRICEDTESNVYEGADANPSEMMKRKVDSGKMCVVKTTTDAKKCSIVAIKKVSNGQIVVADKGNKKLKLLSKDLDPVAELKLPGVPSDMCFHGEDLFLCFPELKKIYVYKVGPSLIHAPSNYGTKKPPVSLSMFDEKRLIILFRTKDNSSKSKPDDMLIEVRDGSCVKATLEHPEDEEFNTIKEGKWVMRCEDSSIILAENEKISCYIVDEFDQWLLCKEKAWVYNSNKKKRLKKPRGFCQDPEGKDVVYVCGEESNNVHQVLIRDFEYRQSRVLVKGVNKPLCSYVDKDRLVVGCHQDDFLHVYTFI